MKKRHFCVRDTIPRAISTIINPHWLMLLMMPVQMMMMLILMIYRSVSANLFLSRLRASDLPFFPFRGGGAERGQFHFFYCFFLLRGFP